MEFTKFIKSGLSLFSVLGFAMWIGVVLEAQGEEALIKACYPVQFVTSLQRNVVTGVVGRPTHWPVATEKYLVKRCYYIARRFSVTVDLVKSDKRVLGGIHV